MDDTEFYDEHIIPNHLFINIKHEFKITRVIDSILSPSTIMIRIDLSTIDRDDESLSERMDLALAKMNYFLNEILAGSVWISITNEWARNAFIANGSPLTTNLVALCPEDPTDAIICELILCKMKSIANGAFSMQSIEIESSDSDGLGFTFVGSNPGEDFPAMEDWIGERSYFTKPWWERDDASLMDATPNEDSDLNSPPSWAYSLGFLAEHLANPESRETQITKIVRPEFRPRVIEGGKQDQ